MRCMLLTSANASFPHAEEKTPIFSRSEDKHTYTNSRHPRSILHFSLLSRAEQWNQYSSSEHSKKYGDVNMNIMGAAARFG